jgi:hypothetical protein
MNLKYPEASSEWANGAATIWQHIGAEYCLNDRWLDQGDRRVKKALARERERKPLKNFAEA